MQRLPRHPVQFLQVRERRLTQRRLGGQGAEGEHAQADLVAARNLLDGAHLHEHGQHPVGSGPGKSAVARDLGHGQDPAPVAERAEHVERLPQDRRRGTAHWLVAHPTTSVLEKPSLTCMGTVGADRTRAPGVPH